LKRVSGELNRKLQGCQILDGWLKRRKKGGDMTGYELSRRKFSGLTVAGVVATLSRNSVAAAAPEVWVLHGKSPTRLMERALDIMRQHGWFGGKAVQRLALKVNAAWARTPEEGANTHPELVETFLAGVKERGIGTVEIPENPCNNAEIAFERSGIAAVAKRQRCEMIDLKKEDRFRKVSIPHGRVLKEAEVAERFLTADAVVNMPVAKHHKGAVLTMAMKNWLGVVKDRRAWHVQGLPQCIADFCTFMEADWTLIDATRCMMDSGPQGPAKVLTHPELLIVSKSQVAADAWTSTLFHDSPAVVPYLPLAAEAGLGVINLEQVTVHRVEVV